MNYTLEDRLGALGCLWLAFVTWIGLGLWFGLWYVAYLLIRAIR